MITMFKSIDTMRVLQGKMLIKVKMLLYGEHITVSLSKKREFSMRGLLRHGGKQRRTGLLMVLATFQRTMAIRYDLAT